MTRNGSDGNIVRTPADWRAGGSALRTTRGVFGPFSGENGGETGIRTLGGLAPTTVFETAPFDHSGTSPRGSGGGAFKAERPVAQEGFSTSFENDIYSLFRRSFSLDF